MNFRQQRIVVTGGAGFLGRRLVAKLEEKGWRPQVVRKRHYDLTTADGAARMYAEFNPRIVVHLAAEVGGIGANQLNPGRFFYANMAMGLHLIEHARLNGLVKFVQVGTACAYPRDCPAPFKEDDFWNGFPEQTNAPYAIAKKALLAMLQGYRKQYGLNGIFLIPTNLYGPDDNFDLETSHVIPALIRKFTEARDAGSTVELWGTGSATREFVYVDDCADALLAAVETYGSGEPINIGSGHEITISGLAEEIGDSVGYKGEIVWDTSKPDGQPRKCLDTSRAKALLGWEAKVSLREGLRRTIEWWEARKR